MMKFSTPAKRDTNKNLTKYVDALVSNGTWYKGVPQKRIHHQLLLSRFWTCSHRLKKPLGHGIELTRQKLSIGHSLCCGFQKNTLAFFGELWRNLERWNPTKHKSSSFHRPSQTRTFITLGLSYFPSIASSIVYDWPIWWGGGNLTRTSVWKLLKSLNLNLYSL